VAITQKIFSSRANNVNSANYVGERGHLFYAQSTQTGVSPSIRYSDGVTPGGLPIVAESPLPANANGILYDDGFGNLSWIGIGAFQGPPGQNGIASLSLGTGLTGNINNNVLSLSATGIEGVNGTTNQINVVPGLGGTVTLSTPQNLNTTASVTFKNITVTGNLNVSGTATIATNASVEGKMLYLATSATNSSQIDGGGIQLGTSTFAQTLLYSQSNNWWSTSDDVGFNTNLLFASTASISGQLNANGPVNLNTQYLTVDYPNSPLQIDDNINSYAQVITQNHFTGTNASTDFVATNDIGNDTSHYIDMGINSSVYSTSSWTVNGANDGYLYVNGGSVAIGTDTPGKNITMFVGGTTASNIISVATASQIVYNVSLVPGTDVTYDLGSEQSRWRTLYVGTGSVFIQDATLGTNAEITVNNGVFQINGAPQAILPVVALNTLTSTGSAVSLNIGNVGDTGGIQLHRTLTFVNGTSQITAWNATATVTWSQITGAPNVTGYTGSAGTDGYTGSAGTNGYTGSAGTNGTNGYTGSAGTNGYAGSVGLNGYTGSVGLQGYSGSAGVNGYTGSIGLQGYAGSTGVNGYTGSAGVNGYTGSAGTNGYTGSQGPQGPAGTSVNIKGSVATASTATLSAIDPSPTIGDGYIAQDTGHLWVYTGAGPIDGFVDVGNVTGPAGAQGPTGYTGSRGTTGYNGSTGATGYSGSIGSAGYNGSVGSIGYTGSIGGLGYTGSIGSIGYAGSASTVAGPQGTIGYAGSIGPIGYTGSQGIIGYVGSVGYTGSVGAQGPQGVTGFTGSFGTAGYTGSFGASGYTGSASTVSGPQGPIGFTGYTGSVPTSYVSSITAGYDISVSTSTGAVTVNNLFQSSTSTSVSGLTVSFTGSSFISWAPSAGGAETITLSNFTAGRRVKLFLTPHGAPDTFTVTSLPPAQSFNGTNSFKLVGGAGAPTAMLVEFFCTTNAIGGVYMYVTGGQ